MIAKTSNPFLRALFPFTLITFLGSTGCSAEGLQTETEGDTVTSESELAAGSSDIRVDWTSEHQVNHCTTWRSRGPNTSERICAGGTRDGGVAGEVQFRVSSSQPHWVRVVRMVVYEKGGRSKQYGVSGVCKTIGIPSKQYPNTMSCFVHPPDEDFPGLKDKFISFDFEVDTKSYQDSSPWVQ